MGFKALSAVSEHSEARGSARVVMLVLGEHADDYGFCRPGIERVAHKCRIDPRSVQRHMRSLEEAGELRIFERPGKANVYQLLIEGLLRLDAEQRRKLAEWEIELLKVGGDSSVRGDSSDPELSPESKGTDLEPSLRSGSDADAQGAIEKPMRRDVEIATAHLQPLLSALSDGGGFDVYDLIRTVWNAAWTEAAESDVNPKAVGVQLCGALLTAIRSEPTSREYGMIGRLVGRFGKLALFGITEALMHDLGDEWLPYATRVCENKKREIEAARQTT